jgi:dolichyl-diphosphooligosaccharide--protein glycosyltransferase
MCGNIAHLMRSVGGGYDNESVAVSCLCLTFLLWVYSISGTKSRNMTFYGLLTGLAYVCMAATWGGFIFVLNMIGLHSFVLFLMGRYTNKLYAAYTLWYVVGTIGAMQVPVIGYSPLRSLEQLAPGCVFVLFQMIQLSHSSVVLMMFGYNKKLRKVSMAQRLTVYMVVFGIAGAVMAGGIAYLWPRGYFGPLSSRIRGLFVEHTRTGNPLVDSVAEHQPANAEAFYQFLHYTCYTAPVGMALAVLIGMIKPMIKNDRVSGRASQDPMVFVVVYAVVTYGFSTKMNRLMLLMGPVTAVLTGIAFGYALDFVVLEIEDLIDLIAGLFLSDTAIKTEKLKMDGDQDVVESSVVDQKKGDSAVKNRKKKDTKISGVSSSSSSNGTSTAATDTDDATKNQGFVAVIESFFMKMWTFSVIRLFRKGAAIAIIYLLNEHQHYAKEFYDMAKDMSVGLSHPSIMFQATLRDGTEIMVDDYREAYWFLRDKTPQDARYV